LAIPKLAFTFWSGDQLSYLHVLTIKSVCFFNPDYEIVIYTTKQPEGAAPTRQWKTEEHNLAYSELFSLSELGKLRNVDIRYVDLADYTGCAAEFSDVHIADAVRILKLKEHGGIWFDFDILFLKPFWEDFSEIMQPEHSVVTMKSPSAAHIWTGFLVAEPNAPLLTRLHARVLDILRTKTSHVMSYQEIGPFLWTALINEDREGLNLIDPRYMYPYAWNETLEYFTSVDKQTRATGTTIGIHWFNGALRTRKFINIGSKHIRVHNPKTPFERDLKRLHDLGVFSTLAEV
jgi:hypothetical protein